MLHALEVNWTIFRVCLEERLVYRGDFALGTLMRFLPVVTQIFLWFAVFQAISGASPDGTNAADENASGAAVANVAGYQFHEFVAYYLLTMVARAFSSMPGLSSGIAEQIRSGEIKKFLIQPIDFLGFLFLSRMAHKGAYYAVAIGPFALVFWLTRDYFSGWPAPEVTAAFLISLVLSFLLGFYMEACLGLVGFWFLEVSSLVFIYMLFNFFLSGHMFPIDMLNRLDPLVGAIVNALPFKYLAYFPAAVFLGKVQGAALWTELALAFGWLAAFFMAARLMWHYGVRQYSGFGG